MKDESQRLIEKEESYQEGEYVRSYDFEILHDEYLVIKQGTNVFSVDLT